MNKTYLYNGSFNSLISLVGDLIYLKITPSDIKSDKEYKINLLDEPVQLNLEKKINLFDYLSYNVIHIVYYCYLSSVDNKELIIYYFIKNALKYKSKIFNHRDLNCVNKILKIAHNVGNEAHKLKGFLRFKQMKNNFYYAEYESTNNVIEILANHFKKRLNKDYWIIKDVKRNNYALYDLKKIMYLTEDEIIKLNLDKNSEEDIVEDLWKTFFKTVAIKERKNLKCQMNFMPKKYWNYIIEMEDSNEEGNK
ncbi:MAG: TIGR03915 family putative DNA repair protein [Bacilli bacterium]|nr:TIGR03915 family putative DNA repair protein [Bacilli bacterium]